MNINFDKNNTQNDTQSILNSVEIKRKYSKQILIKNLLKMLAFILLLIICIMECEKILKYIPSFLLFVIALVFVFFIGIIIILTSTAHEKSSIFHTKDNLFAFFFYLSVIVGIAGYIFSDGIIAKYFIFAPVLSGILLLLVLFQGNLFFELYISFVEYKQSKFIKFMTSYSYRGNTYFVYEQLEIPDFEKAKLLSNLKFKENYSELAKLLEAGEISSETTWLNY